VVLPRNPGVEIVVGGDHGGAHRRAPRARDRGLPLPAGAVCLSPWVDLTNTAASYEANAESDKMFSKNSAVEAAGLYVNGADAHDPLLSWRSVRGRTATA
jgi:acetyl esterase/lipase